MQLVIDAKTNGLCLRYAPPPPQRWLDISTDLKNELRNAIKVEEKEEDPQSFSANQGRARGSGQGVAAVKDVVLRI